MPATRVNGITDIHIKFFEIYIQIYKSWDVNIIYTVIQDKVIHEYTTITKCKNTDTLGAGQALHLAMPHGSYPQHANSSVSPPIKPDLLPHKVRSSQSTPRK